jgi:hypothetical protein
MQVYSWRKSDGVVVLLNLHILSRLDFHHFLIKTKARNYLSVTDKHAKNIFVSDGLWNKS